MKLIAGTPVDGSSDPRTVEQNATLETMRCANSSLLRAEYRGGVLTPNGTFTFNTSIVQRPGSRMLEIDAYLDAGSRAEDHSGGYVLALNEDGACVEVLAVIPSLEKLEAMTAAADPESDFETFLLGVHGDAVPAEAVQEALGAVLAKVPELSDYAVLDAATFTDVHVEHAPEAAPLVDEAAPVAPPTVIPPTPAVRFPHDPGTVHAFDGYPVGTVATITSRSAPGSRTKRTARSSSSPAPAPETKS